MHMLGVYLGVVPPEEGSAMDKSLSLSSIELNSESVHNIPISNQHSRDSISVHGDKSSMKKGTVQMNSISTCAYVYMYVYIYIYIHTHTYMCLYVQINIIRICAHDIYIYIYIHIYAYVPSMRFWVQTKKESFYRPF